MFGELQLPTLVYKVASLYGTECAATAMASNK
jgi:hypothetical protein